MTASIGGTITSQQGEPVVGILVKLFHEPTGSAFAKTSGADGQYQFNSVKVGGPYVLSIDPDGGTQDEQSNINLKIDETFTCNFVI